jgi:hypothetical protein
MMLHACIGSSWGKHLINILYFIIIFLTMNGSDLINILSPRRYAVARLHLVRY